MKDFSREFPPGHLCQLSKSIDDLVFAGSLQDPKWKRTGYFVWKRDTDHVVIHKTILDIKNDWSQDYHVSMLADNESWVTLSFYVGNKLPSSGLFMNEIVQVASDGSQRVRRLAHHRSVFKSYWDSPRANISRDGRFVVFTSNWEGTGQRDVFILKVPAMKDSASPGTN